MSRIFSSPRERLFASGHPGILTPPKRLRVMTSLRA